jgi:hypothetical protein
MQIFIHFIPFVGRPFLCDFTYLKAMKLLTIFFIEGEMKWNKVIMIIELMMMLLLMVMMMMVLKKRSLNIEN